MTHHNRRRRSAPILAVLVLLGLTLLAGGARPAGAAPDPLTDPRPPGMFLEAWSLSPSGVDPTEPGSRAFLAYSLDRGASAGDSVTLWNYSDVALTFHVYATDAFNNQDGEFALLPGDADPQAAGSWITLSTNYVTVAPQTRAEIPITISVPKDATPGDHAAGIVASVPTPTVGADGSRAVVDRRTGTRVYVRVSGTVQPQLVVERMHASYSGSVNPLGGHLTVDYTVRNLGNTRMSARQVLRASDVVGRTVARVEGKRLQDILPGAAVRQHAVLDGVPAFLRAAATVDLRPVAPSTGTTDDLPPVESYSAHAWVVPWSVLLVLVVVAAGWRIRRRLRRRSGPPRPGGGNPPPAPAEPPRVAAVR